jgi:hypothetical protein
MLLIFLMLYNTIDPSKLTKNIFAIGITDNHLFFILYAYVLYFYTNCYRILALYFKLLHAFVGSKIS